MALTPLVLPLATLPPEALDPVFALALPEVPIPGRALELPPAAPAGEADVLARTAVVAPLTMPLRAEAGAAARDAVVAPLTIPDPRAGAASTRRAIPEAPPLAETF